MLKRLLDIVEQLPKRSQCETICKQLAKAGTSIGANVEEANGTMTKKDFVSKMVIARKEAKETCYWLRLASRTNRDNLQFGILKLVFIW